MGEDEPQTTVGTGIDPKEQAIQDGENIGRLAAIETHQAGPDSQQYDFDSGTGKSDESGPGPALQPSTEDLLVVGANGEKTARDDPYYFDGKSDLVSPRTAEESGVSVDTLREQAFNNAGEDAMATEVGNRAVALVDGASEELVKQVREAAEASFKAELQAQKAEKQKVYDDKARELLAKLQSGTSISDLLKDTTLDTQPVETAHNSTDPRNIGLSRGGEDGTMTR